MLRRPPPWSLGRSQSERSFPLTSFTGLVFFKLHLLFFISFFFTSSPKSDCTYLWTAPYRNCISHNSDFNDDDDDTPQHGDHKLDLPTSHPLGLVSRGLAVLCRLPSSLSLKSSSSIIKYDKLYNRL